jgi:hypothetical protein
MVGKLVPATPLAWLRETRIKGKHRTEVTEATEGELGLVAGERQTPNAERRQAICFFLKMMQVALP